MVSRIAQMIEEFGQTMSEAGASARVEFPVAAIDYARGLWGCFSHASVESLSETQKAGADYRVPAFNIG